MILNQRDCPTSASTPSSPPGYLAWHDWAEKKAKTHKQTKCPTCGLWAIWEKREHPNVDG